MALNDHGSIYWNDDKTIQIATHFFIETNIPMKCSNKAGCSSFFSLSLLHLIAQTIESELWQRLQTVNIGNAEQQTEQPKAKFSIIYYIAQNSNHPIEAAATEADDLNSQLLH